MDVYLAKINLAEMQNDLDTAARLVAEALKAYLERSDLHAERSFIEFRQNKIYQSAADAEKAIEFNRYNSHAYVELAYAYHAQGKLDQALTAAETAVSRLPTYDRAHYILGLCYMESNMKEEAIKEFEAFLKSYWDRPIIQDEKRNAESVSTAIQTIVCFKKHDSPRNGSFVGEFVFKTEIRTLTFAPNARAVKTLIFSFIRGFPTLVIIFLKLLFRVSTVY